VVVLVGGAMGGAWVDQLKTILITDTVNLRFSKTLSTGAVYELVNRERESERERERESVCERERVKERPYMHMYNQKI
jgi:hypothetical protein